MTDAEASSSLPVSSSTHSAFKAYVLPQLSNFDDITFFDNSSNIMPIEFYPKFLKSHNVFDNQVYWKKRTEQKNRKPHGLIDESSQKHWLVFDHSHL